MKKKILILFVFVLVTASAWSLGIGGGALWDWNLNSGWDASSFGNQNYRQDNMSLGGFAFLDMTFLELDLSFAYGIFKETIGTSGLEQSVEPKAFQLGISALGKLPIGLLGFYIFPILGINYNMVLSYSYDGYSYDAPMELSQFGLLGGLGLDIPLGTSLFIRGEGLFQLRLPNIENLSVLTDPDFSAKFGMGPRIKLGAGYRF